MNSLAIIQARVGSTRLPGKALKEIKGAPLTEHVVRRTHRAVPNPVLALPDTDPNDELEARTKDWPCEVIRGPEMDVLGRFKLAMDQFPEADTILRVPADNPLISPALMEQLTDRLGEDDWATWRWLPFGIGNSIFTRQSIEEAHEHATSERDREHVTLYVRRSNEYQSTHHTPPEPYRAPGLRLTVDTEDDLRLIRKLYEQTGADPFELASDEAIEYLARHPDLIKINRSIQQKEYVSRAPVLYTMNRGGEWGTGHWARFHAIRDHFPPENGAKPRWYGLLGDTADHSDEDKGVLYRSSDSLNGSTIKLWFRRAGARLVVQDVKYTDEQLVTSLKEEGVRMIGIEDRGSGRQQMDAVVDPNIYEDTLPDDNLSPENRYYGPDYALIDPSFREHQRPSPPEKLETIGVFFGGTDPDELGPTFLKTALQSIEDAEFHYFGPHDLRREDRTTGGPDDGRTRRQDDLTTDPTNTKRVNHRGFVENPADAFAEMDLMVITGGVVKFEVACLNLPAIIIPQNEEQHENSRRFIEKNNLNWPLFEPGDGPEDWTRFLEENPTEEHLASWAENINHVVDGRGLDRFYDIVHELLASPEPKTEEQP